MVRTTTLPPSRERVDYRQLHCQSSDRLTEAGTDRPPSLKLRRTQPGEPSEPFGVGEPSASAGGLAVPPHPQARVPILNPISAFRNQAASAAACRGSGKREKYHCPKTPNPAAVTAAGQSEPVAVCNAHAAPADSAIAGRTNTDTRAK